MSLLQCNIHNKNNSLIKLIVLDLVKQNYEQIVSILKDNYDYANETGIKKDSPVYETAINKPVSYLSSLEYGPKKYIDDFKTSIYDGVSYENALFFPTYKYYLIESNKEPKTFDELLNKHIVIRSIDRSTLLFNKDLNSKEVQDSIITRECETLMKKVTICEHVYKLACIYAISKLNNEKPNKNDIENNLIEDLTYFNGYEEKRIISLREKEYSKIRYDLSRIDDIITDYSKNKSSIELIDDAIRLENNILDITEKNKELAL